MPLYSTVYTCMSLVVWAKGRWNDNHSVFPNWCALNRCNNSSSGRVLHSTISFCIYIIILFLHRILSIKLYSKGEKCYNYIHRRNIYT